VETLEQQQALQAQGCQAYQGFLYSRPLPLEAFEQLTRRPGWPVITPAERVV
jgi:EAL domain-containing protein (putative c-di-GMP-specific phosphodiesterase class I)